MPRFLDSSKGIVILCVLEFMVLAVLIFVICIPSYVAQSSSLKYDELSTWACATVANDRRPGADATDGMMVKEAAGRWPDVVGLDWTA